MPAIISLFIRKAHRAHFSIENVFQSLLPHLEALAHIEYVVAPHPSQGILDRLRIGWHARRHQGTVNHITGDIHFIAFFLDRRRTILTIHDCNFLNRATGLKKKLLRLFWLEGPMRCSGYITTISEASAREIERLTGYPADRIRVIPNPLSMRFQPAPKEFSREKPVILQIGTKENKNLPRLIAALRGLSCRLDIVGELTGSLRQALTDARIEYSSSANLSDEELLAKYHACDLVTLVSTEEGFGLPIIEANATGRPVVTSNISSMPEVAGAAACLVNPYDVASIRQGIERVITDEAYRQRLIRNGLENVLRFSPAKIAEAYAGLYRDVLQRLEEKS